MLSSSEKNLEIVRKQFENDKFAKRFGIVLDDLQPTMIKMHMLLKEEMNNLYDRPHGGAIYALADAAFSIIGNNQNNLSVALECSITYHASPDPGSVLRVEGNLIDQSRRIGTYLFELYVENGNNERKRIATMKSLLYRTGKAIDSDLPVK